MLNIMLMHNVRAYTFLHGKGIFRYILCSIPLYGCKISFIYVNRRPSYCCLCKNLR